MPLLLVACGTVAYHNSFSAPFLFDARPSIAENPEIRSLWPLSTVMGNTSRPIIQLSLAINYAAGGLEVFGYHLFNLAVHLVAGLALFGILRRMFESEPLRARFGPAAAWLAGAIAIAWTVHPLQTQSVTYTIQRAESMMGMFFLLTLYCAIRAAASPRPRRWGAAAVLACALGMGSKEVMAVAPVVVLLYDRIFLAPSFAQIAARRAGLYLGLAATWLVLALALMLTNRAAQPLLMVTDLTPWRYALTQPEVIVHYLRLAFWPSPLVLDYGWQLTDSVAAALPWIGIVALLVAATLYGLHRRHWAGFWGAWFFLILAPTSSIVPIADVIFEHRMYLPLAAPLVVAFALAHQAFVGVQRRTGASATLRRAIESAFAAIVVVALVAATVQRNDDYRSEIAMWSANVAERPQSPRPRYGLATALDRAGRLPDAIAQYREAVRLKPDFLLARVDLGGALLREQRYDEAIAHLTEALRLEPNSPGAHQNLAAALYKQGKLQEAFPHALEAVRLGPDSASAQYNLGKLLERTGRTDDAIARYREALRRKPDYVEAHLGLGAILLERRDLDAAVAQLSTALRHDPRNVAARNNLGAALYAQGKAVEAIGQIEQAVRLDPRNVDAQYNLAVTLARIGRTGEAIPHFAAAVALAPGNASMRLEYGGALARLGRHEPAAAQYAEALRLRPDSVEARSGRDAALARAGKAAPSR